MPILYYWHPDNYRRDLDYGAGYHLNQANPLMHNINLGDSLWAFTRARNGRYVLAAELIVHNKTKNPPNFRYGEYRVWGDLTRSRFLEVAEPPSIEQVIRYLSIPANAAKLGQSFQGGNAVRLITEQDHQILSHLSQGLPLEPRARLLPEERLEAALFFGDEAVEALIRDEQPGAAAERLAYLYQQAPSRNRQLTQELQEMYNGQCQITGWEPRDRYGQNLCHAHHIQWLSRGGEDTIENLMLISPNLHAAVHRCDAPFDYKTGSFQFKGHVETLKHNKHIALLGSVAE